MYKTIAPMTIGMAAVLVAAFSFFSHGGSLVDGSDDIADARVEVVETTAQQPQETTLPDEIEQEWREPELDAHGCIAEMLFYRWFPRFFLNYLDMFEKSVAINQVFAYENFELEVLRAVAFAGAPRVDFGEMIRVIDVSKHIFFSLYDTTGATDLSNALPALRDEGFGFEGTGGTGFAQLYYDASTSRAHFVIFRQAPLPEGATVVSMPITVYQIAAKRIDFNFDLGIFIADVLDSHEASFVVPRNHQFESRVVSLGGSGDIDRAREIKIELAGEDFDPFGEDLELMALGELEIHVYGDVYITNMAFRDSFLFVQKRQPPVTWRFRSADDQLFINLVDTRIDSASDLDVWEDVRNRAVQELYHFVIMTEDEWNRAVSESYHYDILTRLVVMSVHRTAEHAYFIQDADVLPYLDFNASGHYFAKRIPVSFAFPGMDVPIYYMPGRW